MNKSLAFSELEFEIIRKNIEAELMKRDLAFFIKKLNPNFQVPWFHEAIIKEIQNWATTDDPYGLILSMPPGHGKSYLCKHALAWLITRDPTLKIAYASYAQSLAENQLSDLYSILESDEYLYYFEDSVINEENVNRRTREYCEFNTGGFLKAIGRGGGLTGFRLDIGVVDDILKDAQEARSEVVLRECREWYTRVLATRKSPDRPLRRLILNTRWSTKDLTGYLLEDDPNYWKEIKYRALENGQALWDSVATVEDLIKIKASDPEGFESLYQQSPVIEGGNIFKINWFQRTYNKSILNDAFFSNGQVIQSWDLRGGGQNNRGSFAVGTLWFRSYVTSDIYLLDIVRGRWSPSESIDIIYQKSISDPLWSRAGVKLVEKKADGIGALDILKGKVTGLTAITPTSDKETRARAVTFLYSSGNVLIPSLDSDTNCAEFISEHISFPAGSNDDIVDSSSQALAYMIHNPLQRSNAKLISMGKPLSSTIARW